MNWSIDFYHKYSNTRVPLLIFIVYNLFVISIEKGIAMENRRHRNNKKMYINIPGYNMDFTQDKRKWMNLVPYITNVNIQLIRPTNIHKIYFLLSLHLIFSLCFEIDILTSFMLQNLETFSFVTLLVQFVRQYRYLFMIEI